MGRLIRHIAYFVFLIFTINLNGQSQQFDTFTPEDLKVNANTNLAISGENLYFTLWCFNEQISELSPISKIAYVILVNKDKEVIANQKIRLENGMGSGTIYLPTNLKTGQYKLISFTKWMLNNEVNPYKIEDIYILNPYLSSIPQKNDQKPEYIVLNRKIDTKESITHNGIQISSPSMPYNTRSKVTVELENLNKETAFLSISVHKKAEVFVNKAKLTEDVSIEKQKKFYIPELRGEIISGKIINKDSKTEVSDKIVSLSITGNNHIFKITKTNSKGEYSFNLHEIYNSGELIIQVLDPKPEDYEIVKNNFEFPFMHNLEFNDLEINAEIKDWLIKRSIYSQIENAYFQSPTDSITENNEPFMLFGKTDRNYALDDYTRFPTVEKTLIEVLENVGIKKVNGERKININTINETDNFSADYENIVVIDGIPILNHEYLFQLKAERINTMSIYTDLFFHGPLTYKKIFLVNTKKTDFNLPYNEPHLKEKIIAPRNFSVFSGPNYSKEELKRIPDFRTELFWSANTEVKKGKKSFDFYTADDKGVYEIVIKGYLTNGKQIELFKYLSVN